MKWRLEFNVEQQMFHQEYENKPSPIQAESDGWFTVYEKINDVKSCLFSDFIKNKMELKKISKSDILKYKLEFDSILSTMEEVGYSFDDFPLRNKETINGFINLLLSNNFEKTKDKITSFSKNADLYFREISFEHYRLLSKHSIFNDESIYNENDKKYFIVLNHYNKYLPYESQGFDLWLCVYDDKLDIGFKDFIHCFTIRLSCDFWVTSFLPFFNDFILFNQNNKC
jgi:hypothetical protein